MSDTVRTIAESELYRSRGVTRKFITFRQDDGDIEFLNCLMKKKWDIYSVSRLFQFDPANKLRLYMKKMREGVGAMFHYDGTSQVTAHISVEEDFSATTFDEKALFIEVSVEDLNKEEAKRKRKIIYTGYLISRGQMNCLGIEPQLPLLLCHSSKESLADSVHKVLESLFDCQVAKVELRQDDLQWLLAIALEMEQSEDEDDNLCLTFKPPNSELKDKVSISLSMQLIRQVWIAIHGEGNGLSETEEHEVNQLMKVLNSNVSNGSNMKLDNMVLTTVETPYGTFTNGKLQLNRPELAEVVLRFLTMIILMEDKFDLHQMWAPAMEF